LKKSSPQGFFVDFLNEKAMKKEKEWKKVLTLSKDVLLFSVSFH
jgi:hypothetical protein